MTWKLAQLSLCWALAAATAPLMAQTGIPNLDKMLKKVERLAASAPAQRPAAESPAEQPAPRGAAKTPAQTSGAAPGVAAPQPSDTRDRSAYDPLAPPKRLVGVQGVHLGTTKQDAIALLKQRGWVADASPIGDGYWERDGKWRKGQLRLYFRTTPTHIPEGRILDIEFEQKYENPAEGQFDVNKLRDDLIAKFGPPARVMLPGIEWYEGPSRSAQMAASLDQQVVMAGGPKLSAVLGSSYFILRFKWTNLEMEPARQRLRQQKAEADSAPKKKAALD